MVCQRVVNMQISQYLKNGVKRYEGTIDGLVGQLPDDLSSDALGVIIDALVFVDREDFDVSVDFAHDDSVFVIRK